MRRRPVGVELLALCAVSLVAAAGLALAGLYAWSRALGIRDPAFRYENRIGMWAPHDEIGFVNAPHFDAWVFGNVRVRTDARGFRRPAEGAGRPDTGPLLVGFGDSVTWGTSVNEEDSFLGMLRRRLSGRYRVLNAGVVGYASLQEQRFFQERVLPLAPEIAVLNFCHNDLLPTEDPFDNARRIYIAYLRGLLAQDARAGEDVERLVGIFQNAPAVWKRLEASPGALRDLARELLIERPLLELSRRARENGVRLIVAFIPSRRPDARERRLAGRVRTLLEEAGVETLDLYGALSAQALPTKGQGGPPRRPALPGWLRIPVLERIATLRRLERIHETRAFIDSVHPTRRGNALIADALEERIARPPLRSGR